MDELNKTVNAMYDMLEMHIRPTEVDHLRKHLQGMRGMVARIEREAGIPTGTLGYFINEKRGLTKENQIKLISVLEKYGYKK